MPWVAVSTVQKRVDAFLRKNKYAKLNPKRNNDHFIRQTALYGGGCPCDDSRKRCPCKEAPDEIKKKGKCLCGLFVRKK